MPVFIIASVEEKGKVNVVLWNLVLSIHTSMENSGNRKSQQDTDGHHDFIQAVSDGDAKTAIVPTDPEPEGKGDAICVQYVWNGYEPDYWATTIWVWVKSLFWYQ